jgi:hypothetical protein
VTTLSAALCPPNLNLAAAWTRLPRGQGEGNAIAMVIVAGLAQAGLIVQAARSRASSAFFIARQLRFWEAEILALTAALSFRPRLASRIFCFACSLWWPHDLVFAIVLSSPPSQKNGLSRIFLLRWPPVKPAKIYPYGKLKKWLRA